MKKHHYVYKSFEEEGREYIGIRSCDCLPEEDTNYFGSFTDETFNPTGKVILFVGDTRQEVAEIEIELHDFFDVAVNPQFANRSKQTSTKFDTTGVVGELSPMFGKKRPDISERNRKQTGELHPSYGKKNPGVSEKNRKQAGELHPCYGRTGELNAMYGKKNPGLSERNRKQTGELHPSYGKKNPALSERNRKRTGELSPHFATKWWVNSEGETCRGVEPPGPDWQKGRKFV